MSNIETIKILYAILPKFVKYFDAWCYKHSKYPNFFYVGQLYMGLTPFFKEQLLNDASVILEEQKNINEIICFNVFCNSETLKSLRNYIKFMEL